MEKLNILLFGGGVVVAIVILIIMYIKLDKGKKIGFILPFIVVIAVAAMGSGVWLTIQQYNPSSTTDTNNSNTTTTTNNGADTATVSNQIDTATFDANGSVVPKESMDMWGNKTIIDADGSIDLGGKLFTPQGIRYRISDGAYVAIPDSNSYSDGTHYKEYGYSISNVDGTIYVTESNIANKNENASDSDIDLGTGKLEQYPPNSGYEMKYIDFVYKYIPVSKPQNTVKNDFLNGFYIGKQEQILETKTTMYINIVDDKLLEFNCTYIANMNSTYGYKIESLGKNAYKLYLYPATINADTNGGETVIADEPLKRTFLIYMKSKDSFDIVFTSDDIKRTSISMNRQ